MNAPLPTVPDGSLTERQLVGEEQRLQARGLTVEQAMADLCRILAHCEGASVNARAQQAAAVFDVSDVLLLNILNRKMPLGPSVVAAMYGEEPGGTLNDDWLAEPADWGPIRPHHWVELDDDTAPAAAPIATTVAPAPAVVAPAPAIVASTPAPVAADGFSVQDDAAPAPAPKTIADIAARVAGGRPLAEAVREVAEIRDDDATDSGPAAAGCEALPTAADRAEGRDETVALVTGRERQFIGVDFSSSPDRTGIVFVAPPAAGAPGVDGDQLAAAVSCFTAGVGEQPPAELLPADHPLAPAVSVITDQVKAIDLEITRLIGRADALEKARKILLEAA